MRCTIVFTRRAAKDISRLEPGVRRRIIEALERYREDPLSYARKMLDASLGTYRFKIGDYIGLSLIWKARSSWCFAWDIEGRFTAGKA